MTRKDYIIIAEALATARKDPGDDPWRDCVEEIIAALAHDNARFNSATFRKACGLS